MAASSDGKHEELVALVTGASSGFGQTIAADVAKAGHVAYASMRDTQGKNAKVVESNAVSSKADGIDLRSLELDVRSSACRSARRWVWR
jgi:NAD(P)-dependent dehydrogenase (short-subunit alcohol dehydrogenase family)